MKVTVEVDTDQLVSDTLKHVYRGVCEDIKQLRTKGDLKEYEMEDLEDYTDLRYAVMKLLKYFLVREEANKFIREVEDDLG